MLRILIADDHEVVRRGLRQILVDAFEGAEVTEAWDDATTVAAVTTREWDLILLDLNMPGRGGLALVSEVKRLRPASPLLVLTVASESAYAVQSIQAGAAGFVNKRDAADELVVAARKVLAGETHLSETAKNQMVAGLRGTPPQRPHEKLSRREFEVFRQLALGLAVKEIAAQLGLSEKTVGTYLERIRDKTGLRTPVEIARYALHQGLVE